MIEMDAGEMFLNFMLGKEVMAYCGVDITHTRSKYYQEQEGSRQSNWETRERNIMGLMDS